MTGFEEEHHETTWKAKFQQQEVFVIVKEAKDSLRFIECEFILLPSHGRILNFADKALKVYLYIMTRKTVSNISLW